MKLQTGNILVYDEFIDIILCQMNIRYFILSVQQDKQLTLSKVTYTFGQTLQDPIVL